MFIDSYLKICELKGVSPTRVLNDLKISRGVIGNWKIGGAPTNPTKQKLADYFEISVDELMNGKIEKPITTMSNELSALDIQLIQMLPKMSEQEKRIFLAQLQGIEAARGR